MTISKITRMLGCLLSLSTSLSPLASTALDTDSDGVPDALDNCVTVPNPGPLSCDTDLDGYGNACDGDFNNDGSVDAGSDFSEIFLPDFNLGRDASGTGTDMDCNGRVEVEPDFSTAFLSQFAAGAPGPSGFACAGAVPCTAAPVPGHVVGAPLIVEGALPAGASQPVNFFVHVGQSEVSNYPMAISVSEVRVEDEFGNAIVTLRDDGEAPDHEPRDGVYSGEVNIDGASSAAGDCSQFRARANTLNGAVDGPVATYCATRQPRGLTLWEAPTLYDASGSAVAGSDGLMLYLAAGADENDLEEVAARHGADVVGSKIDSGMYQLRLRSPAQDLEELNRVADALRGEASVTTVARDLVLRAHGGFGAYVAPEFEIENPVDLAYLARVRADEAWFLNRGEDVQIAVIDSGVDVADPNGVPYPDLAEKVLPGFSAVAGDFANDTSDHSDTFHGTRMASLAAGAMNAGGEGITGVAPEAKIVPLRVFEEEADDVTRPTQVFVTRVVRAIDWVSARKIDIATLALGPANATSANFRAEEWEPICEAIRRGAAHTLFIASAGNENLEISPGSGYAPASCADSLTVAATEQDSAGNEVRWFEHSGGGGVEPSGSNYGSAVDISAPGKNLPLKLPGDAGVLFDSGSSGATALVAGAAAVLLSHSEKRVGTPTLSVDEVRDILVASAQPMPGQVGMGAGFLDIFEGLTNAGFERDGNRGITWEEGASWNVRSYLEDWRENTDPNSGLVCFEGCSGEAGPAYLNLAQMERWVGDIEPAAGDWMAVVRNGTDVIYVHPTLDGEEPRVSYATGSLGIDLLVTDLGMGDRVPFRMDWALVAALEPGDVPCIEGSGADCLLYNMSTGNMLAAWPAPELWSYPDLFLGEIHGVPSETGGMLNLFPEIPTTVPFVLTANPATWTDWQRYDGEVPLDGPRTLTWFLGNSPVGDRRIPEYNSSGELTNSLFWERRTTDFMLLIDNFQLRSP